MTTATRTKRRPAIAPALVTTRYVAMSVTGKAGAPLFDPGDVVLIDAGFEAAVKAGDVVVLNEKAWTAGLGMFARVARVTPRTLIVHPLRGREMTRIDRGTSGRILGPVILRWCPRERVRWD
jgi:hypothetical protein